MSRFVIVAPLGIAAMVFGLGCMRSLRFHSRGQNPCTLDKATGTTIEPKPYLTNTDGALRWNLKTNRICFDRKDDSGYYRIFTMQPDGSDMKPLTEGHPELPPGHHGSAFWHPSGRYLMFVAQKPDWHGPKLFGNLDYAALPGFGTHDDIWVIRADGSKCWKMTDEPNVRTEGELLPVFSPDGKHAAWTSRQADKTYIIKVADFVESPQPHFENIKEYRPGGRFYYEPGTFSSDGRSLAYTSDQDTHNFWLSQIYRLDLATGQSKRLTRGLTYNEHPVIVPTPTGDWVVYMSTEGIHRRPGSLLLGTDWYAVRLDGTGTKRLTYMNDDHANNPENSGKPMVACTIAISPDGKRMLGCVQDSITKQTGQIKSIRFVGP